MGYRHREALFLATITTSTCCLVGMGTLDGASLVLCSILFSFAYFALGTISNTFMALHTPPRLGGTVFGITFGLAFGFGSMASSTMGFLAERFGLAAVFLALGLVGLGGVALVTWFGAVTTGWRGQRRTG
jgi:MFS family permease